MQNTTTGRVTSRKTTYVQGNERYEIAVTDNSVHFDIFFKDKLKKSFAWKVDFAVEVALTILKGMNRQSLIKTLISLQDFHPGEFVVPDEKVEYRNDFLDGLNLDELMASAINEGVGGVSLDDLEFPEGPVEVTYESPPIEQFADPPQGTYEMGFELAFDFPTFPEIKGVSNFAGVANTPAMTAGFDAGVIHRDLLIKKGILRPGQNDICTKLQRILDTCPSWILRKLYDGLDMLDWEESGQEPPLKDYIWTMAVRKEVQEREEVEENPQPAGQVVQPETLITQWLQRASEEQVAEVAILVQGSHNPQVIEFRELLRKVRDKKSKPKQRTP